MHTDTPLDDVEFLARSGHRVGVLRTLGAGPHTRRELHEETGVSQPTLGRVLGDFEDRSWVQRRGQEYALTAFGDLVREEFEDLLATVETVRTMGELIPHLPTDEMDFDIREFADARVTKPESGDVFAPMDRMGEIIYTADRTRTLSDTLPPGTNDDHDKRADEFMDSDRYAEGINAAHVTERILADPEAAALLRPAMETGRIRLFSYDGEIPLILAVADDLALLAPTDEQGLPVALIETENGTIRSWVVAQLDDYRARSTEVTLDDLAS